MLAVQVENVKKGFPYIMFGDGHLASCKPISEADLASFMADCVEDKDKVNQVLPIGGNSFSPDVMWAGNPQVTADLCSLRQSCDQGSPLLTRTGAVHVVVP